MAQKGKWQTLVLLPNSNCKLCLPLHQWPVMSRILQVAGDEGWQFYVVQELLDVIAEEILIVWVSYRNSSAKKMKLCLYLPKFNLWYPEPLDNKNLALKNNLWCWFYLKNWIGCVCLFFSLHLAWRDITCIFRMKSWESWMEEVSCGSSKA